MSRQSAVAAATVVFFLTAIAGAALGALIGATRASDGGRYSRAEWATMVEQPLADADKAFNWLIFAIFLGAAAIAAAATWAGATVANAVADSTSRQLDSLAALKPKAAGDLPPLPGVKP